MKLKNAILLFLCLFYAISSVKSQGFLLASDASIGTIDRNRYYNFSLNGEYFPSQRFSILYNLDYQMRASGEQSVHVWAGLPLMFFALIDPTLAVVAFIPDGMSYHIPITPKLDIAPYANVLGVDYVWDDKLGYTDLQYATSLGLKFSRWTGSNWIFQGFFETNKNYSLENFRWNRWGFQGGLGLAYNFNGSVDVGLPEYRPEMSNFLSPESSQGFLLGTDASVGLIGGERYYNFSLNSEYFTGNRFSILHSLDYQMKSNGEKSVHIWGSSPLLLLSIIEPTWGVLGLVPDGMSYHIPVAPTMDISPYANVLGFDYVWNDNQKYLDVQYAMSFGLKTSYWTNFNVLVQAFFETKKNYSFENAGWNKWGFEGGIGLAYNIGGVDIDFPEPSYRETRLKDVSKPIEPPVVKNSMKECLAKFENIIKSQTELEKGNLEVAMKVKKEIESLSYLTCYSNLNREKQNRIKYLDQIAIKVIKDNEKAEITKNYSEIGGLRWDNFNSTETKDKDGNELSFAVNIEEWKELCDSNEPAYCFYNFDKNNSKIGLIYNHAAVRVIAPEGYRVPSKKDYELLLEELKKYKQTNTLCSIIPTYSCNICYNCNVNDYNAQLNFSLKPHGWLSVSKSQKDKWKENGEDMYLWTMETEKNNSRLSGLGLAQFKAASSIKTINLLEINNIGTKSKNVKLEDFQYFETYYGTYIRFIKE
jgi:uncharacterized protein (TIGR02145 family)